MGSGMVLRLTLKLIMMLSFSGTIISVIWNPGGEPITHDGWSLRIVIKKM